MPEHDPPHSPIRPEHPKRKLPYWRRAHTDWRFQSVVAIMLVAIVIYVMSDDLAWRPNSQPQIPALSGAVQ